MIIYNWILCCILFCVTNIICAISGEYYINPKDLSYLYHKFDNIEETVFPSDIRIQVSLSRISGTLLYSIDKNMNQLIVSLYEIEGSAKIRIESNKQYVLMNLSKLCGCLVCRYHILDLRIQIEDGIYIQCNNEAGEIYGMEKGMGLNENYPNPYPEWPSNISHANEAHLWLVNTPEFNDAPQNQDQMYGCIHQVWYKGHPIVFANISANIAQECQKTCINDVCNGGRCHETYSNKPICSCTNTFMNGHYCNSRILPKNSQFKLADLTFDMFKVSWISLESEILILMNENVQIEFKVKADHFTLQFRYTTNKREKFIDFKNDFYVANKPTICIVYFYGSIIDIHFFSNGIWYQKSRDVKIDLISQKFNSLLLRSGIGIIDMAYKNYLDFVWKKVNLEKPTEIPKKSRKRYRESDHLISEHSYQWYALIFVTIIVIAGIAIMMSVYITTVTVTVYVISGICCLMYLYLKGDDVFSFHQLSILELDPIK